MLDLSLGLLTTSSYTLAHLYYYILPHDSLPLLHTVIRLPPVSLLNSLPLKLSLNFPVSPEVLPILLHFGSEIFIEWMLSVTGKWISKKVTTFIKTLQYYFL